MKIKSNKKAGGYLFIASGVTFFISSILADQIAFTGVGAAFIAIGAAYIKQAKNNTHQ